MTTTEPIEAPRFTREEWGAISSAVGNCKDNPDFYSSSVDIKLLSEKIEDYLDPTPLPSRLDLLIKWWGEQERPSEVEFITESPRGAMHTYTDRPLESSTHYRRGKGEWVELPTLNEGE